MGENLQIETQNTEVLTKLLKIYLAFLLEERREIMACFLFVSFVYSHYIY